MANIISAEEIIEKRGEKMQTERASIRELLANAVADALKRGMSFRDVRQIQATVFTKDGNKLHPVMIVESDKKWLAEESKFCIVEYAHDMIVRPTEEYLKELIARQDAQDEEILA